MLDSRAAWRRLVARRRVAVAKLAEIVVPPAVGLAAALDAARDRPASGDDRERLHAYREGIGQCARPRPRLRVARAPGVYHVVYMNGSPLVVIEAKKAGAGKLRFGATASSHTPGRPGSSATAPAPIP